MSGENVDKPVITVGPDGKSDWAPPFDFIMTNPEGQTFVGTYKNGGEHAQLVRDNSKWDKCTGYERGDVVRAVHTPTVARWRRFLAYFGVTRFTPAEKFLDFECRAAVSCPVPLVFPNRPIIPTLPASFDCAAVHDLPIISDPSKSRLHRPGVQPTRIVEMDFAEIEERLLAMMTDKSMRADPALVPKMETLHVCEDHYPVEVRETKLYATVDADGRADALYAYGGASYRLRDFEQSLTQDEWDTINEQITHDREWE